MVRHERSSSLLVVNIGVLEVSLVNTVEALNVSISSCLELLKVKFEVLSSLDTIVFQDFRIFKEIGKIKHDLLWDTANIDTSTTNHAVLDHEDLFAEEGSAAA
jgi:hypothetical protein